MAIRRLLRIHSLYQQIAAPSPFYVSSNIIRNLSSKLDVEIPSEAHVSKSIMNPFASASEQVPFLQDLNPPLKRSFNLAAYVNQSETLQELVKLGVSLYDVESINPEAAKRLVMLDFYKDCAPFIKFLSENGIKEKNIGRFISEFPSIFNEHLDDLQTRINYLKSNKFTKKQIVSALNRSSIILSYKVKTTDHKLAQLQLRFNLPSHMVRQMVALHPQIIGLPENQYDLTKFVLSDEFGFREQEIHQILVSQPKILDILRPILIARLDLIHNILRLSHRTIVKFPKLITGPRMDIEQRGRYLKKLKRDQYDIKKPLYVIPSALYNLSDEEFCLKCAKTSLEDYRLFLKSY